MDKIIVLDIETENTGFDVMEDNKRILSIQMLNDAESMFFYADSDKSNLNQAKQKILEFLGRDYQFVGYNIIFFDVPMLDKFLGLKIPNSNIIEISELRKVNEIKKTLNRKTLRLEEVCAYLEVDVHHKSLLDDFEIKYRTEQNIIDSANKEGLKISVRKKWTLEFSRRYALDKICRGLAIFDAYCELINGDELMDSAFYRYAMGDVEAELALYKKIMAS